MALGGGVAVGGCVAVGLEVAVEGGVEVEEGGGVSVGGRAVNAAIVAATASSIREAVVAVAEWLSIGIDGLGIHFLINPVRHRMTPTTRANITNITNPPSQRKGDRDRCLGSGAPHCTQ